LYDSFGDPRFFSDDVWNLDTECIEDEDDYPFIIRRLAHMTRGELDPRDIRCTLDEAGEAALIKLTINGEVKSFKAELDDDWLDTNIIGWVNSLLDNAHAPSGKRFYALPPDDQSITLVFADEPAYKELMHTLKVPSRDWVGKSLRQILRDGMSSEYESLGKPAEKGERKGINRKYLVAFVVLFLAAVIVAVIGYGGNLPILKEIPRNKAEDYLTEHLSVGFTYQGEMEPYSRDGYRIYLYTTDDGLEFNCVAFYQTKTGVMLYANPSLSCDYPQVWAHERDEEMARAFSKWVYDRDFGTITLKKESDIPELSRILVEELEHLRAPIASDPNYVFVRFSFEVVWQPGADKPQPLGYFKQPIGNEPVPSAESIQKELEDKLARLEQHS
jgi:hypothetical protein